MDGAGASSGRLARNLVYSTAMSGISEYAETTTVMLYPTMSLGKWATPEVWPGSLIEYRITVQNTGAAEMEAVEIRDFIPDYVLNVTNISHGGTIDGKEIGWNLGDMTPGASFELTWEGTVDPFIPKSRNLIRNQVQGQAARGVSDVAEATSLVLFPSLVINKTGTEEAAPGDTVQFVIEVHNASAAPVEDVVVKDFIPDFINDPANISYNGYVEGKEIIWEIGSLVGGESFALTWEGTIDLSVPLGQKYLDNLAEICDGLERYCDNALYRLRLLQAEARVIKNATPYGWPGSDVTYTIRILNTGETKLQEVVITDPLPEYIQYPRQISHGGTAVESPFEGEIAVVWHLGDLPIGELVELSWQGTVAKDTPVKVDAVENIATLTTKRGLERRGIGSTYIMHPALRLIKRASESAGPGDRIDYAITLENPSWIPAYEVDVHDIIPTYILTPTGVSGGGETWADEIYWHFETVAPGQVITLTWAGTVDTNIPVDEQVIWNEATMVTGSGLEAEARARSLVRYPILTISKSATNEAGPGDMVDYLVTIKNMGLAPAYGVELHDPIPAYIVGASSGDATEVRADEVYGYFDVLPPGATRVLQWSGQVDELIPPGETRIVNVVTVQDSSGNMDEAEAVTTLRRQAAFIDKTASRDVYPGGPVVYTMTLQNRGDTTLYGLTVTDPIPQYVQNPTAISSGGQERGNTDIVWEMPALAVGEVVTITWSGTVAKDIPASVLSIWNEAKVSTGSGLETTAQAKSVVKQPQLVVAKRATNEAGPGEPVDYTLMIANTGPAPAYDVEVIDPIPAYIVAPTSADAKFPLSIYNRLC